MTKMRDSIKKRRGTTRKSLQSEIGRSGRSDAKLDSSSEPLNVEQEKVDSPKFNHGLGSMLERPCFAVVADSLPCDMQNASLLGSIGSLEKTGTLQKKCDSHSIKRSGTTRKSALFDIGCSSRSDAKLKISSKPLTLRQENVDSPRLDHGLRSLLERPSSTTVADWPPCDRQNDSLLESIGFLKKAFQELSLCNLDSIMAD